MKNREKIIRNYIDGYNQFNVAKMVMNFDDGIVFENIQNGVANLSLKGLEAFIEQAEQAKVYFSKREQTIASFEDVENVTKVEIDYNAILAMDLPNGHKKGEKLHLKGKAIFEFINDKINRYKLRNNTERYRCSYGCV